MEERRAAAGRGPAISGAPPLVLAGAAGYHPPMLGLAFSRSVALFGRAATPLGGRASVLLGALACASLLAACETPPLAAPSVAYEDYRASYERALCEWRASCNLEESAERCIETRLLDRADDYVERAIEAGTIRYDGEMGYQCILEIRERTCDWMVEDPTPSCPHVFEGRVAPEEPCLISDECIGGGTCGFNPLTCTEMCCAGECRLPRPPAEVGDSCASNTIDCAEGTYCAIDPMTFQRTVCVAGGKVGAACGGDTNAGCDVDGYCDFNMGICRPKIAAGAVCQYSDSCQAPGRCEYVDQNYVEQRCVVPVALGEACNRIVGDFACKDFGARCGVSGVCELAPGAGEPCPDEACAAFAYCVDGTCALAVDEGGACGWTGGDYYGGYVPCAGDLRCDSVDYDSSVCVIPESENASCEVPGQPIEVSM